VYLDDLISLMTSLGYGAYGTAIFKGTTAVIPSGDGPFYSVIGTGGLGDEGTHNLSRDSIAYERPTCQVVIRGANASVIETQANALYLDLNFVDQFVNNVWWRSCHPKQEPFELGADGPGRTRWAFNLEIVKRLNAATSH
jgi:hypothetical protein